MTISIFASIPPAPKFPRAMWVDPQRCLHLCHQKGILTLGNRNLLCGAVSMLDLCYLPKLFTIQMFWKESLEQKAIRVSVARCVEMQDSQKRAAPQWFCIPLLGCSHWKKQLRPNHNVFYEKLDKEGRICLMLGSPKAECKMKIHRETWSQNNPVKEEGKQQRRGDSGSQVLW